MTYKEYCVELMQQAIELERYTALKPRNVMTRLKLHAEVGRLYDRSIKLRKLRDDLLAVEVKFNYQKFESKL